MVCKAALVGPVYRISVARSVKKSLQNSSVMSLPRLGDEKHSVRVGVVVYSGQVAPFNFRSSSSTLLLPPGTPLSQERYTIVLNK